MNWSTILIIAVLIAVVVLLKKSGEVAPADVSEQLQHGALVIDVRSPDEFNAGHLATAINLPLDEFDTALPRRVPDKNQVLLLHCQSGVRSAMAKTKAKALGYPNVSNLGSYARARQLVGPAAGN